MNILQISPQIPFPLNVGGRLGIFGITKSLFERGHKITFVCYARNYVEDDVKFELSKICTAYFIDWNTDNRVGRAISGLLSNVPYNIQKYYSKTLEKFLVELIKKIDFDIVHVDHLHMSLVVEIIRRISRAPDVLLQPNLEMKIMKRYAVIQTNFILKNFAYLQYKKFKNYEPYQCKEFNRCTMISEEDEKALLSISYHFIGLLIRVPCHFLMWETLLISSLINNLFTFSAPNLFTPKQF